MEEFVCFCMIAVTFAVRCEPENFVRIPLWTMLFVISHVLMFVGHRIDRVHTIAGISVKVLVVMHSVGSVGLT